MASLNAVDAKKYPALYRATERGKEFTAKERKGWAQVAELRRTRQDGAADRLLKDLLGVKGDPMPEDVKVALRAKRAGMTDEQKRAEREERKADRVLKRLAARAVGKGTETKNTEVDAMAKKTGAKSVKVAKTAAKPEKQGVAKSVKTAAPKERDPRIPTPGGKIIREYKGKLHEVLVLESGFEHEGQTYSSLTALALKLTGAKAISGPAFFKLAAFKPVETK